MSSKNRFDKTINETWEKLQGLCEKSTGVVSASPQSISGDDLEEELDTVWLEINGLRENVLREGTISKRHLGALCEQLEDIWCGLYEAHLALFPR